MKKSLLALPIVLTALALPMTSSAGMKLKIAEDTEIDLGFRVQAQYIATNNDDGNGDFQSEDKFNVRRARLRLGGKVTKWMGFFIQTDAGSTSGGSGFDMRIIDAYATLNLHQLAKFYMGEHMAPAGRIITTSSGGLMTIDRPNITNYNLTWGLNGRANFNTSSLADGNLALDGGNTVRDQGVTLFGSKSLTDMAHIKYYLGVYNGIQQGTDNDEERYTLRVQANFLDPEPGYFNLSTYVGKKKTVAVGFSYDWQDEIAMDAIKNEVDYQWWSADLHLEHPVGPGSATLEFAYQDLDLDDATLLNDGVGLQDARQTQGDGWYVQTGYLLTDWNIQPWFLYESWESDAVANDLGGFDSWRVGLTYFFKGHNANIKAGFEQVNADENIDGSDKDEINTFLIGFYVTY